MYIAEPLRPCCDKCTEWRQKWTWTLYGSVDRVCVTIAIEVQMSVHFALQPVVFYDQPFLSYRSFWDTASSKVPNICCYCLRVPNFCRCRPTTSRFGYYRSFRTTALNNSRQTLNIILGHRYLIYVLLVSPSHKFQISKFKCQIWSVLLYDKPFSRYKVIYTYVIANSPC